MSIEQVDQDIIRQRREDPGLGFMETDFSLKYCGNVVKTTSFRPVPNIRSTFGQYTWRKTPKGICVLESCEFKRTTPGSTTDIDQTYRLTVKSIDLDADVSSATLSFSALKAYLPPNTMVEDRSGPESKSYPLYPALYNSDGADFRRLSRMIRSRGFLKNGE
jgi:hypothetical protein